MAHLAIQLSGSNPNVPPLGTLVGLGMLIFIIAGLKKGGGK